MGLTDTGSDRVALQSVMNGYSGTNDSNNFDPLEVQSCDDGAVNSIPQYTCTIGGGGGGAETPTCHPYWLGDGYCGYQASFASYPNTGCPSAYSYDGSGCCCPSATPILIDISGDGFHLTDAIAGVRFDFYNKGAADQLSWTAPDSDDAWLVLDRDGNGTIDSCRELFGNLTPQPPSQSPNGFIALAEYDKPHAGGNADAVIDARDAVFSSLRLWQDVNHDGVSGPDELHTLPSLNISAIGVNYREANRGDRYGNQFKYRAKVYDSHGAQAGRWAWDVILTRP
ncbi:MAG: hypothetical protein ACLGJB_07810 [Blastocatellia bacterium]